MKFMTEGGGYSGYSILWVGRAVSGGHRAETA